MDATQIDDKPKCLKAPAQCEARRAMLKGPAMRQLAAFVQSLRAGVSDGEVPDFDPLDGGAGAECLFLMQAPGRRAVETGFVSRNNPDETAKNWHELNESAGIDRRRTLTWNIVPWYIGGETRIRPVTADDIQRALPHLRRLLMLLPNLRIVVLVGRKAERAESSIRDWAGQLEIFRTPHPSPRFVNRTPQNRDRLLKELVKVRDWLDSHTDHQSLKDLES